MSVCTAFWLWSIAQALLLPNWIAGLSGLVSLDTLYIFRIEREEALMRATSGAAWDEYAARTKRLVPYVH